MKAGVHLAVFLHMGVHLAVVSVTPLGKAGFFLPSAQSESVLSGDQDTGLFLQTISS